MALTVIPQKSHALQEPNAHPARWFPLSVAKQGKACRLMGNKNDTSNVTRQIDESLRHVYREMAEEDVPDRFKQLLERLKEQEKQNAK
ncbi:NepR family anti-sigma factor [Tranquillimonas alkanivorans]|nr:NepR family anti-sigma factor [Tranquillimonas alkanivorans]